MACHGSLQDRIRTNCHAAAVARLDVIPAANVCGSTRADVKSQKRMVNAVCEGNIGIW